MGMAVDAAGQHQLAPRVDLALRARQPTADGGDGLAGDADIGLEYVARGRDTSAADQKVVGGFGHGRLRHGVARRSSNHGSAREPLSRPRSSCDTVGHPEVHHVPFRASASSIPNSNLLVTKALEDALKPLEFAGRAGDRLRDAG